MRTPLPASCLVLLAACGGGGGGSPPQPPPGPVTVDILAVHSLTGTVSTLGALAVGADPIRAGDLQDGQEQRAFASFALGDIPANAAVTAAELRLTQSGVQGTPYADFASLLAESVDLGADLDASDFLAAAITTLGSLAPHDATLGLKTVDALQMVLADRIAGRSTSTARLRFVGSPGSDSEMDIAGFALPPGDPTLLPILRVTYQP